jgi:hypothetical protein
MASVRFNTADSDSRVETLRLPKIDMVYMKQQTLSGDDDGLHRRLLATVWDTFRQGRTGCWRAVRGCPTAHGGKPEMEEHELQRLSQI